MTYQEPKDLSDFTTEELSEFGEQYSHLADQIEGYIYRNKPLLEYINTHDNQSDATFDCITGFEYGRIKIRLEYSGCGRGCCPSYEDETSIPIEWITEEGWKAEVKKIETAKKAKETKERREKERKAKEAKVRKEEKDVAEYKRLQEKFGNKV